MLAEDQSGGRSRDRATPASIRQTPPITQKSCSATTISLGFYSAFFNLPAPAIMPNPVPLAKQALTENDAKYNLLE